MKSCVSFGTEVEKSLEMFRVDRMTNYELLKDNCRKLTPLVRAICCQVFETIGNYLKDRIF